MTTESVSTTHYFESPRHRTTWIEKGPTNGRLMIFIHGWPMLGIIWLHQMTFFSKAGWRCIAPDMRGYGGSSKPSATEAYELRKIVEDMTELHESLGGSPAVWIGHDWGCPVVWCLAAHHPNRCKAVVNICVPYIARGFALPNLLPLVDREIYPEDKYPAGQWDYFLFYRENFIEATQDFEEDVDSTVACLYRAGSPEVISKPALTANIRGQGGWFGPSHRAPAVPRDENLLSQSQYDTIVSAFKSTGYRGANAWYVNDDANMAYATEAPNKGILLLPVLFIHASWDSVCNSAHSKLSEPMRRDCEDLSEITIEAGHSVMLERPDEVNEAIAEWIVNRLQ